VVARPNKPIVDNTLDIQGFKQHTMSCLMKASNKGKLHDLKEFLVLVFKPPVMSSDVNRKLRKKHCHRRTL